MGTERIFSGDYVSEIRNLKIAGMFKQLKMIEKYGSGFSRIITAFKAYNLKTPVFENFQSGFRTTVFAEKINEPVNEPVNDVENVVDNRFVKIIKNIEKNNKISATELSKILSVSQRTIERDIDKLKKRGKLKRIGSDKTGHWQIINSK